MSSTLEDIRTSLSRAEKGMMERVSDKVINEPDLLDDLFRICISNEKVISWRAAWVLNHLTRKNKALIRPLIPEFIRHFPDLKYDGQKACFLRSLSNFDLDDENLGMMVDACLDFMEKETSRPFMISYSMDFLQRICEQEPELSREIRLVISSNAPHFPTPYLQKKAARVMNHLTTLQNTINH